MPHEPEEIWTLLIQPFHLAIFLGLAGALTLCGLLFWRPGVELAKRHRYLKFLLVFHFLFWTTVTLTLFMFLESIMEGESFRTLDYSFSGLRLALGIPLVLAFITSVLVTVWGSRRLQRQLLARLDLAPVGEELWSMVDLLALGLSIPTPSVRLDRTSSAYSLTIYGRPPNIVISTGLVELLEPDELEAVIAHELAHVANRDCFFKLVSSILARFFYFDPLTRRLRTGLCRDREFLADETAVRLTGRPLDLISALLKLGHPRVEAHSPSFLGASTLSLAVIGGHENLTLPILGSSHSRLVDHPPLNARVRRLLKLYLDDWL